MKTYKVYRDIRKGALIFGLPVSLFALLMIAVVGSLLVIIFSFSLGIILALITLNLLLYFTLLKLVQSPGLFHLKKVFPSTISNKQINLLSYED
ncbi:hypothetical protein MQE36_14755 [Zhouia spongiae]|uniref:DUF4133 domain-containing protein n=1 Tax=Zhouia spongiae TaxID=2202721 RepID=A0ABY3YKW7_9FLAO|nr:hypothetical protein [Zhouia spongiae]UNY98333.1 hypothetical protein MQE36_14755 [Zhouia spongiae]